MIIVTMVTVTFYALAVAFIIVVDISGLAFAWESAVCIRARKFVDQIGIKLNEILGTVLFGSEAAFQKKFENIE